MTIQFNTGRNVNGNEALAATFIALISDELKRFSRQITRVEVHLSDEDGNKASENDKRCILEARLDGLDPIVATNLANTYELAVAGATKKMKSSLDKVTSRLSNH